MVAITAATVLTLAQLQHDSLSPFPITRLLTDCGTWVQEIQYQVLVYLKLRKWGGDIDGSHKQHGSMEKVSILKTVSSGAVAVMATINRQFSLSSKYGRGSFLGAG